jgi:predicted MFS family arabinose efflux permease
VLAGVPLNPALTTMSLLVDDHTPRRAAEAFGWLSTATAAGAGAGSAIAGVLAQHHGSASAFLTATIAAAAATLLTALTRTILQRPTAPPS